ncbi:putative NUDIX family hydrolase [Trypanosoma conorhini]|uniref:Putative NUDIX family hydrolase n=1 Tax=Trypanosoma conorhini TaxID=83891 RepID=A0A422MXY5_9TRYP|nr:putative NUDIX family hydrolase [Trypanosoma conorhini]RNE98073.1 putative NUDIX family hydrolase [Trypanosoma conorhini]
MPLPAVDVNFLLGVARRMQERRLHVYVPGTHRSAVAIVLRFGEAEQQRAAHRLLSCRDAGLSSVQLLQPLAGAATAALPSSLRVLFVRRADLAADRWSGSVTFPGGRRDAGDANDRRAVEREVDQMLGIPLQSRDFVCLGRLRDYAIRSRHIQAAGAVQSRFVFLHTGELAPTLRFSRHEVEAVQWVPLTAFTAEHVDWGSVCHPICCFVHASNADSRLLLAEAFAHAYLAFPSVQLPGQWRLWGLALRSASELLSLDDRAPIDWPLVSSNNPWLQHLIIDAFHGYCEVRYAYHRLRARLRCTDPAALTRHMILPPTADAIMWGVPDRVVTRHVLFLSLDVALLLLAIYCVAGVIFTASVACRTALGWMDADGDKRRLRAYYAANVSSLVESAPPPRGGDAGEGAAAMTAGDGDFAAAAAATGDGATEIAAVSSGAGDSPPLPSLPNTDEWEALRSTVRRWAGEGNVTPAVHEAPAGGEKE